jgi:hypothetical protein
MHLPQSTAAHALPLNTSVRVPDAVTPMLNECHYQCLLTFSVCGYLEWGTADYCNAQFAHCIARCEYHQNG